MVRNNPVLSTKHTDAQFTKTNQNITLDNVINIIKIGNDISKLKSNFLSPSLIQKQLSLPRDCKRRKSSVLTINVLCQCSELFSFFFFYVNLFIFFKLPLARFFKCRKWKGWSHAYNSKKWLVALFFKGCTSQ